MRVNRSLFRVHTYDVISDLLQRTIEQIDRHPNDNSALADRSVKLGVHKRNGSAYGYPQVNMIKKFVEHLNG